MSQRNFYLDWVPHASNSAISDCREMGVPLEDFDPDVKALVSALYFMSRSDGITIFEVVWIGDRPGRPQDRIAIAQALSHRIKRLAGHRHTLNDYKKFPTISVAPVELDDKISDWEKISGMQNEKLTKECFVYFWKSDLALYLLKFSDAFGDKRSDRTAIFLLRKQYARVVRKALEARSLIRERRVLFFRLYGWGLPLISVFTTTAFISLFRAIEINWTNFNNGITKQLFTEIFTSSTDTFISAWPFSGIIALIWIYYANNLKKRKAILQALRKAESYLKYGDIYNSTLSNLKGIESFGFRRPTGFTQMISLVGDMIKLEKEKEAKTQFKVIVASLLFLPEFFGRLLHIFPDLEPLVAFLYYFKGLHH